MSSDNESNGRPATSSQSGRYKDGNTGPDGNYLVGKCRTPEHTRFRKNDGRKRGKRKKGDRNFSTILKAELDSKMTLVEGGQTQRVSKMHGIIKRHLDNALRGQNVAIQLFYTHALALLEADAARGTSSLGLDDLTIIEQFVSRQLQAPPGDAPSQQHSGYAPEGLNDDS